MHQCCMYMAVVETCIRSRVDVDKCTSHLLSKVASCVFTVARVCVQGVASVSIVSRELLVKH